MNLLELSNTKTLIFRILKIGFWGFLVRLVDGLAV